MVFHAAFALPLASALLAGAPPLRPPPARSSIHMQQSGLMSRVNSLNTMNKMKTLKKEAPKLRGKRLPPAMLEVTSGFKREYAKQELEVLWAALLKIYGKQDLAEQAVRDNPQILNPSY